MTTTAKVSKIGLLCYQLTKSFNLQATPWATRPGYLPWLFPRSMELGEPIDLQPYKNLSKSFPPPPPSPYYSVLGARLAKLARAQKKRLEPPFKLAKKIIHTSRLSSKKLRFCSCFSMMSETYCLKYFASFAST